jgi:hypothetical protein
VVLATLAETVLTLRLMLLHLLLILKVHMSKKWGSVQSGRAAARQVTAAAATVSSVTSTAIETGAYGGRSVP